MAGGHADKAPHLILDARPFRGMVEMEFLAVFEEENIEDQLAYLSERAEVPDESEVSFRLLRHYASTVRHRKYHGMDIVTVQSKVRDNRSFHFSRYDCISFSFHSERETTWLHT